MSKRKEKAWQGKAFIGLMHFFSWFSLRGNHVIGASIGYLLWWLPNSPKRVSSINLRQAFPDLTDAEHQALLKQSLLELGKTATELGVIWMWKPEKVLGLVQEVRGREYVTEAFDKGKGLIMLSPHIGCWEVMGMYLAQHYPMTALYRPPNVPSLETFMKQVRERNGSTLVPTDLSGVKKLRGALRRNEMIGILPDQDPGDSGGVYAPFYGHPARTMVLVSKLAAKADCEVLFSFAERLPKGQGYRLHILPALSEVASKDELEATTALNQGVEQTIATVPAAQYQWSYKRYKHPPEGVKDVYQKPSKTS